MIKNMINYIHNVLIKLIVGKNKGVIMNTRFCEGIHLESCNQKVLISNNYIESNNENFINGIL
jgi:hypothetical protein